MIAETAQVNAEAMTGGDAVAAKAKIATLKSTVEGSGVSGNLYDHIDVAPMDGDRKVSQTCRYCGKNRSSGMFQSTKWASHLLTCPSVPFPVRKAVLLSTRSLEVQEEALGIDGLRDIADSMLAARGIRAEDRVPRQQQQLDPTTPRSAHPNSKRQKTLPMAMTPHPTSSGFVAPGQHPYHQQQLAATAAVSRVDPCDVLRADRISLAIMTFLASSGLPVAAVNSPSFLSLLRSLNRTYADKFLPRSDVFASRWLPGLYNSVDSEVKRVWVAEKNMKRTLGLEAFDVPPPANNVMGSGGSSSSSASGGTGPSSNGVGKLCVFTESYGRHVVFQECMVQAAYDRAGILLKQMETVAAERGGGPVEEMFSAVSLALPPPNEGNGDTSSTTAASSVAEAVHSKYPKIFVNGCRSQCATGILKQVLGIDEIRTVVDRAVLMAEAINSHPTVTSAFYRISDGATIARPRDLTNLSQVLGGLVDNSKYVKALVRDEEWETIAPYVPGSSALVSLVSSGDESSTFDKMRCLNRMVRPLCVLVDHIDRHPEFRPSWIVPLFEALVGDARDWANDADVTVLFETATRDRVKAIVEGHWKGYNSDHYLLATLFDPSVFPEKDSLPGDWLSLCTRVLKRFFSGSEMTDARQELMKVVACSGMFGDEVEQRREQKSSLPKPKEEESGEAPSRVVTAVSQQAALSAENPHLMWDTVFYRQFPLLGGIASRLLAMSTRANAVERSCDVDMLAKASHLLYNKKVYMLLYSHVNLRLLHAWGQGEEMDAFMDQAAFDSLGNEEDTKKAPGEA